MIKDIGGSQLFSGPVRDTKVRDLDWAGEDRLLLTTTITSRVLEELGEFAETLVVNLATSKSFVVFGTSDAVFHATDGYYGSVHEGAHWYGYFAALTMQKTHGLNPTFSGNEFVDL